MDFVTGYEVERSPSNHGPCPVCDAKAGQYSKDFKFTGLASVLHLYSYAGHDGSWGVCGMVAGGWKG